MAPSTRVQYDYREFFAATDDKNFQVVIHGNPFPGADPTIVARDLLPMMQAAKPDAPPHLHLRHPAGETASLLPAHAGLRPRERSQQRLGLQGHDAFQAPGKPGVFNVYAIYCRNDMTMSETTAWTPASGPDDPRIAQLFRELFMVIFSDSPSLRPNQGGDTGRF